MLLVNDLQVLKIKESAGGRDHIFDIFKHTPLILPHPMRRRSLLKAQLVNLTLQPQPPTSATPLSQIIEFIVESLPPLDRLRVYCATGDVSFPEGRLDRLVDSAGARIPHNW